jgi:tetratricopeptide (TPR) repeat protein/SAM-dependent methyltransferase
VALAADTAQMTVDSIADLMHQATARHSRGELEDALRVYARVLAQEPEHSEALHLTGVVAHQQGRNEEAVALIARAITSRPRAPAYRNNLGMALTALGRTAQAESAYQEALALAPDFADALLNLGNLRAAQGSFQDAVGLLERAIAADADSPQAHYNLGCARFALDDLRGALGALQRAMALGADFAEVHYRTGSVHTALGETQQAIACFHQALAREGDHLGAQHGLLECLGMLPPDVAPPLLEALIVALLRAKAINPRALGHPAARLIERKHGLGVEDAAASSLQALCASLLDDTLARLYLRRTINVSAPMEHLLTRCRTQWLADAANSVAMAQSCWDGVAAVAIQCFFNEFVWAVSREEERSIADLEQRIVSACRSARSPEAALVSDLLVYACYRPLWRIADAAQLRALAVDGWPDALARVLRVSLHEPLWEQDAKAAIDSGVAIRDAVSRAVQMQYEENPYPRWQALTRAGVQSIEQRVQRWNLRYAAPPELTGPLRVLVAGCGTGMDAIDMALHLRDAQVTAIDLSSASLAYALRKAGEYGLENIHFRQDDIIELDGAVDAYHVINCSGVLHHMQDPATGLQRLVRMLMPDGLIRLALYSRLARGPLLEVREVIRARGYASTHSDIREFRQRVLDDGAGGRFAELMGSTDFYSSSECRDLLFHVQETELSVPDIGRLLEGAGLEFLGFELTIAEVERGFRREHPHAALTDLQAWAVYEQQHPESFRAMYQFWCRKL